MAAVVVLAHNGRTAQKAAIKRASAAARAATNDLDATALDELERIYRRAADELATSIRGYAGNDGSVRLEVLQDLLFQIRGRLESLAQTRDQRLAGYMSQAAVLGVRPFESIPTLSASLTQVADNALRFTRSFQANDGLQLSDRLWRLDMGARRAVGDAIQSAVIQGHSASSAARDFVERGVSLPPDVAAQLGLNQAERLVRVAGDALLRGEGNPYELARRVFRTEINRAHGEAYRAAAFDHPDVIGTRFLLSPSHPKVDICDMHASVNRYGLGRGVYPKGKSPWPAHPNTLSYEEVVFEDEVTADDRAGQETRIDWLKRQSARDQESVLGGRQKRAALAAGLLTERQITTPWKVLRVRYARQGVDVDELDARSAAPALDPGAGVEAAREYARDYVRTQGQRTGHEHAVAIDLSTGEELLRKTSRQPSAVFFSAREERILTDPSNRIELVHNHPRGTSLSIADLQLGTVAGVERVVAVAHDGPLFSARSRGSSLEIRRAGERIGAIISERLGSMVRAGLDLEDDLAWHVRQHMVNRLLDRLDLIEYEVQNISGKLRRALDRVGDLDLDRLADDVLDIFKRET